MSVWLYGYCVTHTDEAMQAVVPKGNVLLVENNVLLTSGIMKKMRAACDAGVQEVLLPVDNLHSAGPRPNRLSTGAVHLAANCRGGATAHADHRHIVIASESSTLYCIPESFVRS